MVACRSLLCLVVVALAWAGCSRHDRLVHHRQPPPDINTAARTGDVAAVRAFLGAGVPADSRRRPGSFTPLHLAALNGHADVVGVLLEAGADPNAQATGYDSVRPLHMAGGLGRGTTSFAPDRQVQVAPGKLEAAKALVAYGADARAVDDEWRTPLHWAAQSGNSELVAFLLQHGADPTARESKGRTPYDLAREEGHKAVIAVLEAQQRR